jgi:hypothetical protein
MKEIVVQRIIKTKFTNHAPMQVARILLFFSQMAALDSNGLVLVMPFFSARNTRSHLKDQ